MRLVCFLRRINRYNPDIRYDWYAVIDSRWFELAVTQGVKSDCSEPFIAVLSRFFSQALIGSA